MKGRRISDHNVVKGGMRKEEGGYFTEFEYDGLDAHVLGKGNVYDHLPAGSYDDIISRLVVVRPHLIVHARICKLGRILAIRPLFDEFLCLLWDCEI